MCEIQLDTDGFNTQQQLVFCRNGDQEPAPDSSVDVGLLLVAVLQFLKAKEFMSYYDSMHRDPTAHGVYRNGFSSSAIEVCPFPRENKPCPIIRMPTVSLRQHAKLHISQRRAPSFTCLDCFVILDH